MDFLTNIETTVDRDKLLYEIELFKRQDFENIRQESLVFLKESSDLKSLKNELINLTSIEVVMALNPTPSIISLISENLRKTLNRQVILNTSVNESIIGGLIIIFKGKYMDLSVLSRLN